MKNFTRILFSGALMVPFIGASQVNVATTSEGRNAVIEEWTGIYCQYCPAGHVTVQEQIDANPGRVVALNIHSGGYAAPSGNDPDFRTPHGDALDAAFPISGYPAGTLNRRTITYTTQDGQETGQVYHPAYMGDADFVPTVLAETSEVNMHISSEINITTNELTVSVEYYYTADAPSATNYLNVALTQNNVHGPQIDAGPYNPDAWLDATTYNHMHMFRGFITPLWGDPIVTTTTGSTAIVNYTYSIPADINGVATDLSNMEIVAYINDGFESAGDVLTGVSVKPTLTGFSSSDEVVLVDATQDNLEVCDITGAQTISPKTTIKNWGSNALTSATITYDVNGGTAEVMNWTGNIAPGASEEITLDPITFNATASNTLNVTVSEPNGQTDVTSDNSGSTMFDAGAANAAFAIRVDFFTDNYPGETSWEIRNSSGTVVASGGPYTPGTDDQWGGGGPDAMTTFTTFHTLPTANDCYSIRLTDSFDDGQQYGTGENNGGFGIEVSDVGGSVVNWDPGAGFSTVDKDAAFKTDVATSSIDELSINEFNVYPNPSSDVVNITFDNGNEVTSVVILDLQGRVVATGSASNNVTISVADLAKGSYLVQVATANGSYTKNITVK